MKREPLLDNAYFERCVTFHKEKIEEKKERLASQSADVKRWDLVYAFLFDAQLHNIYNHYSIGTPVDEIKTLIHEATETYITYMNHPTAERLPFKDSYIMYEEALSVLSLNLIIRAERNVIDKLASTFDLLGKDSLIDKMLSFRIPDRKISTKLAWPKVYEKLYAVFSASKEDQPNIVKAYLSDWYKTMKKASWHGAHKRPNVCAFSGYWSMETAAVTRILQIDDEIYKDSSYYPVDLVHFNG
jgi:hypothetical protein